MLSDDDYIFAEFINNSRISIEIQFMNQNSYESVICKIFYPPTSDNIFINIQLNLLEDCLKENLFSFLIFNVKGVEDKNINFSLKSIFNKKREIKYTSDTAIVIPYSNFYLYFNQPKIDSYKKNYTNSETNFNYNNVYYNSDIYNLKKLPTHFYNEEFEYSHNFYNYIQKSINNFEDYDLILDFDLYNLHENYNNLIFPYHQEHLDISIYENFQNRLNDKSLKPLKILSHGTSILHKTKINSKKTIIQYLDEDYELFKFEKNYCYEDEVFYDFEFKGDNTICDDKIGSIGELTDLQSKENTFKLFPFKVQGNVFYHLYELNFPNGQIIQFSNDFMSLNFPKYSEIYRYVLSIFDY